MTDTTRLALVRGEMAKQGLDAWITPRADEYLGEYVPPQNERLHWLSGFNGSAGMAVVLPRRAAIFVDGRYTIQVRQQVPENAFEYHHLVEEPPVTWLTQQLEAGARVGIDSRMHTLAWFEASEKLLARHDITLVEAPENPVDLHWQNRPQPETRPVMLLGEEYTGEHSEKKRARIGGDIAGAGADCALLSQPDSIAWLLNIRGGDVPRLPVLLSFAVLEANGDLRLFTDPAKLPNDFPGHVGKGVTTHDLSLLPDALEAMGREGCRVLADPDMTSAWYQRRCREAGAELIPGPDPVLLPKAQKNQVELQGIRNCHVRDGAAVSRYLAWIDRETAANNLMDEAALADRLEAFRRAPGDLHDLSFDTISAAGANGAIVHYNHKNGAPAMLEMNNLYLVDSGGQYADGTTDITRTIVIGEPSDEHRRNFTLVLKGHIALARAIFPPGTSGGQLDTLARQFLWREGLDYDHGTGHGVGAFLSVHEGPQRIAKAGSQQELLPGMVISNEPGYYQEDGYGIRCENLIAVQEREDGMLEFETLTLAPFDLRLVDRPLLTDDELGWLNGYHAKVREKLSPLLEGEELAWLQQGTAPLG